MANADRRRRSLRVDAGAMFVARSGVGVLSFVAAATAARALGPEGQGAVAVGLALTLLMVQVGAFGVVTANPVIVARSPRRAGSLVANSVAIGIVVGAALAVAGASAKAAGLDILPNVGWDQTFAILVAVPFALVAAYLRSILLGQQNIGAYSAIELGAAALTVGALVWLAAANDLTVIGALLVLLAQYPIAALAYLTVLLRQLPERPKLDAALAQGMMGFAMRVYLGTFGSFLLVRLDLLLVAGLLGQEEAGFYSAAAVIGQGIYVLPMVVGMNMMPRVARGHGHEHTSRIFRLVTVYFAAACLAVGIGGKAIIAAAFGPAYEPAISLLYWLLPGIYFLGLLSIITYHLAGEEYPVKSAYYWVLGLTLNVVLDVFLLPVYGVVVAPVSSSVCYGLVLVLHLRFFGQRIGDYRALIPRVTDIREGGLIIRRAMASIHR